MSVEAALDEALRAARADAWSDVVLVAVSGGSDSLALLHLTQDWARAADVQLRAVTVDHGLRAESADEAAQVHDICAGLGVRHDILHWQGWQGQGNLQQAARGGRYALIADLITPDDPPTLILIGHTKDDLAETFLMRLARGSGVDGLSAMREQWQDRGQRWCRPLLAVRRQALRDWLTARRIDWIDDPSNENERFDRVKMRKALDLLEPLGLGVERLAGTAQTLSGARLALQQATFEAADQVARIESGDVVFDLPKLSALPAEIRDRLMTHALMWISSNPYRPRRDSLSDAMSALNGGQRQVTLHGCLITQKKDGLRVAREYEAVRELRTECGQLWDGRWYLSGQHRPCHEIKALGQTGLDRWPDWRETGLPRSSLLASPAVWEGETLIAAPLAGMKNNWSADLVPTRGDFFNSILSH